MHTLTLNNGLIIPAIGFGTYKAGLDSIIHALEGGCRYFDTASYYGNERDISRALGQTGIKREEVFIASKVWKSDMGYDSTIKSFSQTLENLGSDYVDVYMIHWPRPNLQLKEWKELDIETWKAMEYLHSQGKIKALGLSNFLPYHAESIFSRCEVVPSVAQLEFHPGHIQFPALEYYRRKGVQVQAWSPIGRGRVLSDELILELAGKYHVTPAQICIRFCIQEGVMPLPRASSPERVRENLECLNFALDDEDILRLENMPPLGWSGEHPDRERVKI
ncbi:MAG: aldo/keto reductase [Synergistaceae bacterium]|nr:aldo/keto reductase [Synergistaceae bacterium]